MSRSIRLPAITRWLAAAFVMFTVACDDTDPGMTAPVPVASITIAPANGTVLVGRTLTVAASLKDAQGNVLTGRPVQWTTSDASVAAISTTGLITGVAEGIATITARSEGKAAQAQLTVNRIPVATVALTPTTVVLERDATRQLTAVALDETGAVLEGRFVMWSTDAPQVATVSASGVVRAVAPGYAVITAAIDGRSASSAITVPTPEPVSAYDLVFERRQFNGLGTIDRLSLTNGTTTAFPVVSPYPGTYVRDLTPSPDGQRVAFTLAWYANDVLVGDVYVANIDGSGFTPLATGDETEEQPAWSPDGSRIAFRSNRSGNWDIWVMNADGTGQRNLMTDFLPATSTEMMPVWSPDGSRIAYASDIDNYGWAKLWTMRADGTDKRQLLPQSAGTLEVDDQPSWSPDGSRIAFRRTTFRGDFSNIVVLSLATGQVRSLTMPSAQHYPAWSPDGARIAFVSDHGDVPGHVYTMKTNGTDIVLHTTGNEQHLNPQWLRVTAPAAVRR